MNAVATRLRDRPRACQALVTLAVASALVLPLVGGRDAGAGLAHGVAAALLVAASIVNVEIARFLEGRRRVPQRPHKALSAWAFATVLLLPAPWLLLVVPATYAHTWWRGVRPAAWKWVGSAAFLVLAGMAADGVLALGPTASTFARYDAGEMGLIAAAAVAFLATEALLFLAVSRLNTAEDEDWLRGILADPSFYLTETGMLAIGGLTGLLASLSPAHLLLMLPCFGFLQQAALHSPLAEKARTDEKTGALRYEAWRELALAASARSAARRAGWAVVFIDVDHFKRYNDRFGHLAGDQALLALAASLRGSIRAGDLVGRFGGEEFVVFLSDVPSAVAERIAERIRCGAPLLPGLASPLSVSIGVATVGAPGVPLSDALKAADHALYDAKRSGRDLVVHAHLPAAPERPGRGSRATPPLAAPG